MPLAREARATAKLPSGTVKSRMLYNRWTVMRRRCYDSSFVVYPQYGGRGITVCDEWRTSFVEFQRWALSHGWKEGLTLDRIDSAKGYSPGNCRWITLAEQQSNRPRWCRYVTIDGKTDNLVHWADKFGIPRGLAAHRARAGWDPVDAVRKPVAKLRRDLVEIDGEAHTIYGWASRLGFNRSSVYPRVRAGEDPADVIRRIMKRKDIML
jgi:hypothetical protein